VASLQARSPLRSAHPLVVLNKLISLIAFIVLLGAGWVVLSYLRTEMSNRSNPSANDQAATTQAAVAAQPSSKDSAEVKRLATPVKLVYSCSNDREHYHISTHLPSNSERSALSEEAAVRRGLKPCPICMPE
jgi:ABC-type nickel/cobalt efflux system permease component RcnA